ncbi:hypothetical protein ACKVWM_001368 [Pyricularia oryzae]
MGIEDLFEFSKREYAQHVALKTDAELKQHEIRKTQQLFSTTYTISAGIAATALTCGASLGAAALGGRKYYIAQAKLKMIEDELTKRNIKLHQLRKRDAIKPLIVHLVGAGVGFGVHDVLLSATTTLPLHGQLPQDAYEQLTQYATANPGHAVHATVDGALHGMREQLRESPKVRRPWHAEP